jgi:hypothetical protein
MKILYEIDLRDAEGRHTGIVYDTLPDICAIVEAYPHVHLADVYELHPARGAEYVVLFHEAFYRYHAMEAPLALPEEKDVHEHKC